MATIKIKLTCSICNGTGFVGDTLANTYHPCETCGGFGYTITVTEAGEYLDDRPEKLDYTCVCGKTEGILRPYEHQIPTGWVNWDSSLLCDKCKLKVLYAGMVAMAARVDDIRSSKETK